MANDSLKLTGDESRQILFTSERHVNVECILHFHADPEIVLVTEGILNMTVGGVEYVLSVGEAVFIPSFVSHQFHSPKANRCHVLMFCRDVVRYFDEFLRTHVPVTHCFSVPPLGMELVDSILPAVYNETDYIHAQAILSVLCCAFHDQVDFREQALPNQDVFSQILDYMQDHFCEELTLERVGKALGLHPVTVCKLFSARSQSTFGEHLNYLRASYSAMLIKTESLTLSAIAYQAGFGSIRSFNRVFSHVYGMTPTQYKKHWLA